jgi:hypothetical protein
MVSFQTKNPNLGNFWRALDSKMLSYFTALWTILHTFGIFYDNLVHFCPVLVSCTKKIWQPEKGRPDKKDLLMTGPASGVHEVACMPITPQ